MFFECTWCVGGVWVVGGGSQKFKTFAHASFKVRFSITWITIIVTLLKAKIHEKNFPLF